MKPVWDTLKLLTVLAVVLLAGCFEDIKQGDEETKTYTIGGTVTGLTSTLVLQNNGGDDLTRTADGAFTFATALTRIFHQLGGEILYNPC